MSARLPELQLISPAALVAASWRILAHPTYNAQRVALDEIYTFATATMQFDEICRLAAAQLEGAAAPSEIERLREHLTALGFVAPSAAMPAPTPKETSHG